MYESIGVTGLYEFGGGCIHVDDGYNSFLSGQSVNYDSQGFGVGCGTDIGIRFDLSLNLGICGGVMVPVLYGVYSAHSPSGPGYGYVGVLFAIQPYVELTMIN